LETRYGRVPVTLFDEEFLGDINAARLACRHLGVNDKEFYAIFECIFGNC
jgi:UDP-N-acetylmuramate: L-alanyl-gamma-D-glutamyl-meso-diaminopimelate ligase